MCLRLNSFHLFIAVLNIFRVQRLHLTRNHNAAAGHNKNGLNGLIGWLRYEMQKTVKILILPTRTRRILVSRPVHRRSLKTSVMEFCIRDSKSHEILHAMELAFTFALLRAFTFCFVTKPPSCSYAVHLWQFSWKHLF